MPAMPILAPTPRRPNHDVAPLSEADIDRFATLFSPATPPATPTLIATQQPNNPNHTARRRKSTQGSADSDFGAFVSVPPSQDPLSLDFDHTGFEAHAQPSLVYFDQFTASARTADERNRRGVLDELLLHQDDPMYFLHAHPAVAASPTPTLPPASPPPLSSLSTSTSSLACPIPIPMSMSTDDALAEALASDMANPKLIRVDHGGCLKVAPNHARSRRPLPPRLSGSASPPSISSPMASSTSLSSASPPLTSSSSTLASGSGSSASATHPAHATLSRISSSLVSLLPRPRSTTPAPTPASAPTPSAAGRFHTSAPVLTHGSPFASTPYIPPTGAPGFAGDRGWDRGFSEALAHEEIHGLVDPVGLGFGTETTAHARHSKGKGVVLCGRREATVRVLTEEMADLIRLHLPALTKLPRQWTLLYSLDQHGISLNTLYARCAPRVPSRAQPNPPTGGLLAVQDAQGAVFGAWLSEGIRLEKGGYYGSGEAFLWRFCPAAEGRLDVYAWTGANAYVALCEPGFVSLGGGDGHYGLYLDASLLDGSSAPCPTFGNPPLCASGGGDSVTRTKGEVSFECVGLEVWGIGSG